MRTAGGVEDSAAAGDAAADAAADADAGADAGAGGVGRGRPPRPARGLGGEGGGRPLRFPVPDPWAQTIPLSYHPPAQLLSLPGDPVSLRLRRLTRGPLPGPW